MVKISTGRLAVPLAAALALLLTPLAASADPAAVGGEPTPSAPPMEAIETAGTPGSLRIVKLGASSEMPAGAEANGAEVEVPDAAFRIPGVQFRIDRVTSIDLTQAAGWAEAGLLAEQAQATSGSLGGLLAGKLQEVAQGCTGWKGITDPAQVAAIEKHCGALSGGGSERERGELTFTGLPVGVYLVSEQETPPNVVPALPFLVTVPMPNPDKASEWLYDITVYPKNSMTSLSKTVQDNGLVLTGEGSVTYTVSLPLPKDSLSAVLTDVLDEQLGFALSSDTFRIPGLDGGAPWSAESVDAEVWKHTFTDGTVVEYGRLSDVDPQGSRVLRVTYGEGVVAATAQSGGSIGFEFDATIKTSGEIPNTASYVVTAPGGTATGETSVDTKWGGIDILKVTPDGNPLPGASFNVADSYQNAVDGAFLLDEDLSTDANGHLSISGLRYSYWKDGAEIARPAEDVSKLLLNQQDAADTGQVYWLVETKAPLGFALDPTPVPFRVDTQSDGHPELTITNEFEARFDLPAIGGNRAILPVVAAVAAAGGVVWLIRSRRVTA